MAATILSGPQAFKMSGYVVRTFVHLRELLTSNQELVTRLNELEQRIEKKLTTHDQAITGMINM